MGEVHVTAARLDASKLLERVLRDNDHEALVTPMMKAARSRSGSARVAQLKRVFEAETGHDDHE